jgi:hypothetical protein
VREFIAEFRGLARSDVQKTILDITSTARMTLREFFAAGSRPQQVAKLLNTMRDITKPVLPKHLGLLGREHFCARFEEIGVEPDTFQYRRALCEEAGLPYAIEAAFGYCPDNETHRRIVGVNWTPTLLNPFRTLGGRASLDAVLEEQRAGKDEPIVLALHLAAPRLAYTDKAKSALALPLPIASELFEAVLKVTGAWARVRKAEERDASAEERRLQRLARSHQETIKDVAYEVMEHAYLHASNGGELSVTATQIMYAARPTVQERTGKQLESSIFQSNPAAGLLERKLATDCRLGHRLRRSRAFH